MEAIRDYSLRSLILVAQKGLRRGTGERERELTGHEAGGDGAQIYFSMMGDHLIDYQGPGCRSRKSGVRPVQRRASASHPP